LDSLSSSSFGSFVLLFFWIISPPFHFDTPANPACCTLLQILACSIYVHVCYRAFDMVRPVSDIPQKYAGGTSGLRHVAAIFGLLYVASTSGL